MKARNIRVQPVKNVVLHNRDVICELFLFTSSVFFVNSLYNIVIGPEFRMEQYRDDGYHEHALQQNLAKLGCVLRMVVDSVLRHAESGPNDHRKDTPPFIQI